MTNVLFISEAYLKQFSPIASNVSNEPLTVSIRTAQNKYILPALGKTLYDKIVNDIETAGNVSGVTGNYKILLDDYITPALTEYSLYEAIIPMVYKMQNKGIGTRNDQYQESIGLDEIKYLRGEILNNAQWYQERMVRYLVNNTTLFPEYTVATNDLNADASAGTYNSGVYFLKKRRVNPSNPFTYTKGEDYETYNY